MASIGLKSALYNVFNATTKKYKESTPPVLGRIISETFSPEYASVELRADDILAEEDKSFIKGTLNVTIADDEDSTEATLFGNTVSSGNDGGEVTKNVNDEAPFIGYGHIITKQKRGTKSYKVEFFPRCKVNSITHDANTRGESVEFGTTAVDMTAYPVDEAFESFAVGDWNKVKTFDTESAALSYLAGLLTPSAASGETPAAG